MVRGQIGTESFLKSHFDFCHHVAMVSRFFQKKINVMYPTKFSLSNKIVKSHDDKDPNATLDMNSAPMWGRWYGAKVFKR